MTVLLRYEVLGPLRLLRSGEEISLGPPKRRLVLALLLCARGRTVSMAQAIDQIWPDNPPASARNIIHQHIHHLRGEIGDDLRTDAAGYALHTVDRVDAIEFEEAVERARTVSAPDRVAILSKALDLWRGAAFADFSEVEWPESESLRLAELRTGAIEDLAEALVRSNRAVAAVALLTPHLREHPLSDRPHGLMMRALAAQGRQTEALRLYQRYRSHLGTSVGLDPSDDLRELEERIAAGWRDEFEGVNHEPETRPNRFEHSVPADLDLFIERPEVGEVAALASEQRLLTIVGPGGIGKSRTAKAAGRSMVQPLTARTEGVSNDGVWFIDLAPASNASEARSALITGLEIRKQELSSNDTIFGYVRDRRLVLILDNCEHLIDWVRTFVAELSQIAPGAHVIATSRVPLGLPGEHLIALGPMSEAAAISLFETRATAVGAGPFDDDDVRTLCSLLNNYPLALELAAARTRTMSPREISDRLGEHPRLLHASGGAAGRHRSLDASLHWSLEQLDASTYSLLVQASMFPQDFDLSAAEAILDVGDPSNVLDHLGTLVDQSLVVRDHERARFRILEPIRQSLLTAVSSSDDPRDRYGRYFIDLLAKISRGLLTVDEPVWWNRLTLELSNLRLGVRWAIATQQVPLIEAAMLWFPPTVNNLLFSEAVDWAHQAIEELDAAPADIPATSLVAAMGWHRRGDFERSEELLATLAKTDIDATLQSMFCFVQSTRLFTAGDAGQAVEWAARGVDAAQDPTSRTICRMAQMDPDSVREADQLGTPTLRAYTRFYQYGLMDEATKRASRRFVEDSYYAALASENPYCIAAGESVLASVLLRLGDTNQGASLMISGCRSMLRYRSHFLVRHVVETTANGLAGAAMYAPAVVLWSAMDKTGRGGVARNLRNPALPKLAAKCLTAAEFAEAEALGRTLTIEHAADFAFETLEKLTIA